MKPLKSYKVTVKRGQSLKQMIAAGHYDYVNSDITAKHFPVKGRGKADLKITLVYVNQPMSADEMLKDMDPRGFRPATLEELLALGAAKPDLQRRFAILALGSLWKHAGGHRSCPILDKDGSCYDFKRVLDLYAFHHFSQDWGGFMFAFVRK